MKITVDQRSSYYITYQPDTATKCSDCGNNTLHRDYSRIQLRLLGYTVSAVIPSRRCAVCRASRVDGHDLNLLSFTAVYELFGRGIRDAAFLVECRRTFGNSDSGLATMLKMRPEKLVAVLKGETELDARKWDLLGRYLLGQLRAMTQHRLPIPYRVTKPRVKK